MHWAGLSWTGYARNLETLERSPRIEDMQSNSAASRNVTIATVVAGIIVLGSVAFPRLVQGVEGNFVLDLLGAVTLFLWVFLVAPQLKSHRFARQWARAYRTLCDDFQSSPARIRELELQWNAARTTCTVVDGRVAYAGGDGLERLVPLVSARGKRSRAMLMQLPASEAPSVSSRITAWHTSDQSVVYFLVHADGSGAI